MSLLTANKLKLTN